MFLNSLEMYQFGRYLVQLHMAVRGVCLLYTSNIEAYDKQASMGMKALMDTEVYAVPIQAALTAVKELPGLAWEYANYLQKSMVYLCVVNNRRMYFSSNQRYQWFCEKWRCV